MIPRHKQAGLAESFQQRSLRERFAAHADDTASINVAKLPRREANRDWKINNILAPTDFSAGSAEAVAQAAALARRYDASLTILHVIDSNPALARTHVGPAEELMKQLWAAGTAGLRQLSESLAQQQIKAQTQLVEGLPAEVIIEHSANFDLLVISEEHSKPAWRLFSRHTVRRVIEGAACPLLVVPARKEPENLLAATCGQGGQPRLPHSQAAAKQPG
jgi:nucleotide-binding universal stress UspA family protein